MPGPLKSRLDAPRGRRNDSREARRVSAVAGNSQKPPLRPPEPPKRLRRSEEGFRGCRQLSKAASMPPRGRRNDSGDARRVSAVAGNSYKPFQHPPEPPKRLRRSEKVLRSSRQLSKAASTPPRGRRNDSEEARRVSAVAGTSQKSLQRPPGPPKRLQRSEEGFRGCRQLSKAVSTPPKRLR